jgi:ornithine decarboxylase
MTPKIERFLAEHRPGSPCLVVDLDVVAENYRRLQRMLPAAVISYAVKANPAREILEALHGLGSHFDAASIFEIEECLAIGVSPSRIVFGNTIKKRDHVASAFERGIRTFAFDSLAELDKIAAVAGGSRVYCRLLVSSDGAQWPLSNKFGCELEMAYDLMMRAGGMGLDPYGLSFHVGSQQTNAEQWAGAIGRVAEVHHRLADAGLKLRMVNLGGGYPVRYRTQVPTLEEIGETITGALTRHFGNEIPEILIEPGRSIAADAGVIEAEVVLVSRKRYVNGRRWVYLDIGMFGGLTEAMDGAIKYPIVTPHDGRPEGPVVIAGPTCDSADILYDDTSYALPLDLAVGDKVHLLGAGAYTTTYSSVGFNGFPPLSAYYL